MGANCCAQRDDSAGRSAEKWFMRADVDAAGLTMAFCGIRGHVLRLTREYHAGEDIVEELPIALVFPSRDAPWLAALRADLKKIDAARAGVFCLAVHCLAAGDLPVVPPVGVIPVSEEDTAKIMDLPKQETVAADSASYSAVTTAVHVLKAARERSGFASDIEEAVLAAKLDDIVSRISLNVFSVQDGSVTPSVTGDAVYFGASFVNTCSAGHHTAIWRFDPVKKSLSVKAFHDLQEGDELTFASDARRAPGTSPKARAVCACTACCDPSFHERLMQRRAANLQATEGVGSEDRFRITLPLPGKTISTEDDEPLTTRIEPPEVAQASDGKPDEAAAKVDV
eukprot:CAMPEP_0176026594 /NCGR_PEP_ID=MMETSP0120_2-20121206/13029_1 /TAXON_ID=160619 /ORGANISM="Kryptoperidinium foliaceum, Strain CCMP 1326" /LENGTH=339 /DNA_ID=CAMNT_0017359791 /DNA_START=1 /DNA_END=1016 /DNA_ORIENTATION=-